jgi:alkanesulfonate monooxygenase SsuD/methylene tetrahydromethanopterin reductase-like flavin-dependent oxidoreductase (luciferase family)
VTFADPKTGERRTIVSGDDPDYLSPDYVRSRMIVGSPDTCARIVADLIMRGGIDRLVVRGQFPGQPQTEALTMLESFITDVPPRVEGLLADADV